MTNKEFQQILALYPDDYEIQLDNAFGWEVPSNKHKSDPHLYINSDCGYIEIEPPEIRTIWNNPENELPKECQNCLILRKKYLEAGFADMVEFATYDPETNDFTHYDEYDDGEEYIPIDQVAAWMPIPAYE